RPRGPLRSATLVRHRPPALLPVAVLCAGRGHRGSRGCHSLRFWREFRAIHLLAILNMLPRKTSFAILTLGAFILMLEAAKLARPFTLAEALDFRPRNTPAIDPIVPIPRFTSPAAASKRPILEPNLIDPHDALRAFYLSLWRTELGAPGAITRVLHYGDSPVTADSITADVRSLLQQHFGDSGHGFVLIAKPWAWYGHRGVEVQGKGWRIAAATQTRARDGFHGLGGVSFEGDTGASSRFELAEDHAQMEIHFLRQPG